MRIFTKTLVTTLILGCSTLSGAHARDADATNQKVSADTSTASCLPFLNEKVRKLHSKKDVDLCALTAGKPVLLVNTASNCGFTPQFKSLEALHKKYKEQGLVVLGFPSDDFFQEEDNEKDTADICYINYGVTFTMLTPNAVRGSDVQPVFKHLGDEVGAPKWNFFKYLVSADGKKIERFNSKVKPDSKEMSEAIERVL
jgi:glutathione peroxidase